MRTAQTIVLLRVVLWGSVCLLGAGVTLNMYPLRLPSQEAEQPPTAAPSATTGEVLLVVDVILELLDQSLRFPGLCEQLGHELRLLGVAQS